MPNLHNCELLDLFPDQDIFGTDYGNFEFKCSTKHYHKFTVLPKDNFSEFILFHDHLYKEYYLCRTSDLPYISKNRSFRVAQIKSHCMWWTRNEKVLKAFIDYMKESWEKRNE